jgi:hypothetical protein
MGLADAGHDLPGRASPCDASPALPSWRFVAAHSGDDRSRKLINATAPHIFHNLRSRRQPKNGNTATRSAILT